MPREHLLSIAFQAIAFLFAISIHESAHAFTAWRCGDPTAKMLGRVSLNPIRHIDPFGTVILPLIAMLTHLPVIGWAKPTPVDPRNFRHPIRDDIFTSVAGPVSNFAVAAVAEIAMVVISASSPLGRGIVGTMAMTYGGAVDTLQAGSILVPITGMLYTLLFINVLLGVFNLIPVPPLDGSHVVRHVLSDSARQIYDRVGMIGLLILVVAGGRLLSALMTPFLDAFNKLLLPKT
jgi:Zn-dependent protease